MQRYGRRTNDFDVLKSDSAHHGFVEVCLRDVVLERLKNFAVRSHQHAGFANVRVANDSKLHTNKMIGGVRQETVMDALTYRKHSITMNLG